MIKRPFPRSKRLLVGIITIAAFASVALGIWSFAIPRMGKRVFDQLEVDGEQFRIRMKAHPEINGGPVAGAYYVFESAPSKSDKWRNIFTIRLDDPIVVPRQHIRILDNQIGYAFMGNAFAITLDAGMTWAVWKGDPSLFKDGNYYAYQFPENVEIHKNGTGTMILPPIQKHEKPARELHTTDYGKHWSFEGVK